MVELRPFDIVAPHRIASRLGVSDTVLVCNGWVWGFPKVRNDELGDVLVIREEDFDGIGYDWKIRRKASKLVNPDVLISECTAWKIVDAVGVAGCSSIRPMDADGVEADVRWFWREINEVERDIIVRIAHIVEELGVMSYFKTIYKLRPLSLCRISNEIYTLLKSDVELKVGQIVINTGWTTDNAISNKLYSILTTMRGEIVPDGRDNWIWVRTPVRKTKHQHETRLEIYVSASPTPAYPDFLLKPNINVTREDLDVTSIAHEWG